MARKPPANRYSGLVPPDSDLPETSIYRQMLQPNGTPLPNGTTLSLSEIYRQRLRLEFGEKVVEEFNAECKSLLAEEKKKSELWGEPGMRWAQVVTAVLNKRGARSFVRSLCR